MQVRKIPMFFEKSADRHHVLAQSQQTGRLTRSYRANVWGRLGQFRLTCAAGLLAISILLCLMTGCTPGGTAVDRQQGFASRAADPTIGAPGAGTLAATVNDQPIRIEQLNELLVSAHGLEALRQLTASAAVRQVAQNEGISVTSEDIDNESAETLREQAPNLDQAQRELFLRQYLPRKKVPRVYWDMAMTRNAVLRKLAVKRLKITDSMLTAEFNRRYGLKVVVRHIRCASVADAQNILERLAKGEDFAELAQQYSTFTETAMQGGLYPPFSRDETKVPSAICRAAFDLADGQVSEIVQVDKDFHILKREKTIPRKEVAYEDVKDQLRNDLITANIRPVQTQILQDIVRAADVRILDPILKAQEHISAQVTQQDE
ncbi:MAG: peptidylprolyl isomerase [Planctomycetes bacterium]|nr:peptidylprolyl isomerase [Planctomycetota bacterium]